MVDAINGLAVTQTLTLDGHNVWHEGNFNPASKLDAAEFNAAEVLARILTADGAGSGLDADLLDGLHASAFAQLGQSNTFSGDITIADGAPSLQIDTTNTSGDNLSYFRMRGVRSNATGTVAQMDFQDNTGGTATTVAQWLIGKDGDINLSTGKLQVAGGDVWHQNNDGAGSGLDADLLDGSHASAFAFLTGAAFTGAVSAPSFTGDGSALTGVEASDLTLPVVLNASDATANAGFSGITVDINMSGSDATTSDKTHRALYIDVDSSASGGDTNHEHRVYGVHSDVRVTGDSDLVYSGYLFAQSNHSTGTVTNLAGAYNYALANNTGGTVSNTYGSQNLGFAAQTGAQTTVYGSYSRALHMSTSTSKLTNGVGVYAEVENDSTAGMTNARAVQALIDRDAGTIDNAYLFQGNYTTLTGITNPWGLYIATNVPNYLRGDLHIGSETGGVVWHEGNDGPGSGLDADLLDGMHASEFLTPTGNGGQLTGVDAEFLGGQSASAYARLSGATFTGTINAAQVQWNGSDVFHPGNMATGSDARAFGGLGVGGASSDATNKLSVNSEAVLLNNAGDDMRLTMNKAVAADDTSLTMQTGFSTRAQVGLTGNDDLTLKVSPDGSAFHDGIIIDRATGRVTMPNTPAQKFSINNSGRVYLYGSDDRWVTNSDDVYGPNYYQMAESGLTGVDPVQEWEHMGDYVREGTVIHDLAMLGRITDTATIADLEILLSFTAPNPVSRWDTTGLDNDGEDIHTTLWRGFWKAGGTGVAAFTHPVNDHHRRTFPVNFTTPTDGQLRIYYKPHSVDPRPNTTNDYFYHTYSWLLSYA